MERMFFCKWNDSTLGRNLAHLEKVAVEGVNEKNMDKVYLAVKEMHAMCPANREVHTIFKFLVMMRESK